MKESPPMALKKSMSIFTRVTSVGIHKASVKGIGRFESTPGNIRLDECDQGLEGLVSIWR